MPQYVDVKGVSDSGKRFIEYTLAAGFDFFVFVEEPLYASYLTSAPRGVSARYHFVEMITEGGHGISRPMTTGEIITTHPELTPSQVNELRDLYNTNKNRRPFKVPLESTISPIIPQVVSGGRTFSSDFFLYFSTTRPLKTFISKNSIGASADNVRNALTNYARTDSKFVGARTPLVANVGDIWLNSLEGKVFIFMSDGTTGGTSGTGMTSAWVEVG